MQNRLKLQQLVGENSHRLSKQARTLVHAMEDNTHCGKQGQICMTQCSRESPYGLCCSYPRKNEVETREKPCCCGFTVKMSLEPTHR